MSGKLHRLGSEQAHTRWKANAVPVLEIEPVDMVEMECREGFDGQVDPPVHAEDLDQRLYSAIDFRRVAPVTGPIAIRGAAPGDSLEVRILELTPFGTGNLVIFPSWMEVDFLAAEQRASFPQAWIKRFDMDRAVVEGSVRFADDIRIPIRPMLGVVGTAPAQGEFTVTGPPRRFGGNMDIKSVSVGSKVYLPIFQPGGLFSAGDGHAIQGDGEICTTGLETPMRARVEFHLHKARTIEGPQIETADEFMVVSYGRTLDEAGRRAIGDMIEYLAARHGLSRHEAYGLLSLAGDLRINQVVDFPHVGARVAIPKAIFASWRW
jgi:acetamidase/formamidase